MPDIRLTSDANLFKGASQQKQELVKNSYGLNIFHTSYISIPLDYTLLFFVRILLKHSRIFVIFVRTLIDGGPEWRSLSWLTDAVSSTM